MRTLVILAFLFAIGCGAAEPSPEPAPAPGPGPAAGDPRIAEIRGQIALKREELRREEINLGNIEAERLQWDVQPASETKTNRLAELARLRTECLARCQNLQAEIAALERKAQEMGGPGRASSADEDLAAAVRAVEAQRKKEEAERAARERPAPAPGPSAPAAPATVEGDRPLFEERYAAQILQLKLELQRFKRW